MLSILRFWRRRGSLGNCWAAIIMANFLLLPHFDSKFGSWSQLDTVHYTLITICSAVIVMCNCKCKCKPTCSPLPFQCGKKDCFCTLHITFSQVMFRGEHFQTAYPYFWKNILRICEKSNVTIRKHSWIWLIFVWNLEIYHRGNIL